MSGTIKPMTVMINATNDGQITDYTVMSLNRQLIKRLKLFRVHQSEKKLINCSCTQVHDLILYVLMIDEREEADPDESQNTIDKSIRKVNVLVEVTATGEVMNYNVNVGQFALKKLNALRVTEQTRLANCSQCGQAFEIVLYYCTVDKDDDEFVDDEQEELETKPVVKFNIKKEEVDERIESIHDHHETHANFEVPVDYQEEVSYSQPEMEQVTIVIEETPDGDNTAEVHEDVDMEEERLEDDEERIEEEAIDGSWEMIEEQHYSDHEAEPTAPQIPNFFFSTLNESIIPEAMDTQQMVMTCPCNTEFSDMIALFKHKRYCEQGKRDTPYCFICGSTFKFWQSLLNHIKNIHGTKPFECELCGARERTASEFQEHLLRHEDAKPFKCEHCSAAAFSKKQSLKLHIRKEHDANFEGPVCELCPDKKFASPYLLKKHVNEVHCVERTFSCNECDKMFKTRAHLKNHINNVHFKAETGSGECFDVTRSQFQCDECPRRSFTARSSLVRHQMIHSGVKPYTCSGKSLRTSDDYKSHMR